MKKWNVLLMLVAVCIFGLPFVAFADSDYVGVNVGYAVTNDVDVGEVSGYDVSVALDGGYTVGAILGHKYDSGSRAEVEVVYQVNEYDSVTVSGLGSADLDGDVSSITGFFNLYHDFDNDTGVTPFIGAGVGWTAVDAEIGTGSAFAYQASCGLGFNLSETVMMDVQYRYFATADLEINETALDYENHVISVGLRSIF